MAWNHHFISELVHCNAYRNLLNIQSVVSRLAKNPWFFQSPDFPSKNVANVADLVTTWFVQVGRARVPGKRVLALAISRWPATSQVARESKHTGIWVCLQRVDLPPNFCRGDLIRRLPINDDKASTFLGMRFSDPCLAEISCDSNRDPEDWRLKAAGTSVLKFWLK